MGTFGSRLTEAMICAGMTVRALAERRKVSPQTIRDWRRMASADLSGAQLVGCGLDLNTSIIWLASGVGSSTPNVANRGKERFALKTG